MSFQKGNLVYIKGNKNKLYRISGISGITEEGYIIYKLKDNENFKNIINISEDKLIRESDNYQRYELTEKDKKIIGKY